jgi:rod shape-determining protein MreC
VLVGLVLLALVLLTVSFRSPTSGALHSAQGWGAVALRPFQVAAERVARPFGDAYDWAAGLTSAKSENAKLKRELRDARAQASAHADAEQQLAELQRLLHYEGLKSFPHDFRAVNTSVISFPGTFAKQATIAAGSDDGIAMNTPVVTADGLVGHVTNVSPGTAQVTLLTDPSSSVPAIDVTHGVTGLIQRGPQGTFILNRVPKDATVQKGDLIVTRGTVDRKYPDFYPRGIQIGTVLSASASDIATFLTVQVTPFAQFDSLDAVAALVPTKRK